MQSLRGHTLSVCFAVQSPNESHMSLQIEFRRSLDYVGDAVFLVSHPHYPNLAGMWEQPKLHMSL